MVTSILSSLYLSLFYLCLLFSYGSYAVEVGSLLSATDRVGKTGLLLNVFHKSQLNAKAPNLTEILIQDQLRVDSIHSILSNQNGDVYAAKIPAYNGASLGTGNYYVNIGLGSPTTTLPLVFDTGSTFTWARCSAEDKFDPDDSSTYKDVLYSNSYCRYAPGSENVNKKCGYSIRYGDGSSSAGLLATDRLTIASDAFDDYYFGCGRRVQGDFGRTQGILGLARGELSVVTQTASKYKQLFSYALPASPSSTGFLSFGTYQSQSPKFTPLSTSTSSSLYYLDMTGISVAGNTLAIPSSVFTSSGTIIDSGAVFTFLAPGAYCPLRSAFRQAMAKYPMAQPFERLDTCYDLSGYTNVKPPKIVFSFKGGVDVDIDPAGILYEANGSKQVCLGFTANEKADDHAVIGNRAQFNYEVVYDVAGARVGFAPVQLQSYNYWK